MKYDNSSIKKKKMVIMMTIPLLVKKIIGIVVRGYFIFLSLYIYIG